MTLLDVCGFETGRISNTASQTEADAVSVGASATFAAETQIVHTSLSLYSLGVATGASSVVAYFERDWGSNQATICFECYVRFTAVPAAVTYFASIYDSTPAVILDIGVNASGNWIVKNAGNATTYTGTGPVLLAATWYRIELKLYAHGVSGTIDLKVNSVLHPGVSGISGINTLPGGQPRRYRVGVTVAQASAGARYIDNIQVDTDWIGRGYVSVLRPNGSDATAWTIVDGGKAAWQTQIDVPFPVTDTLDLIKSSTANQEEIFTLKDMAKTDTGLTILGVQGVTRHARAVAGSAAAVTMYIRSGSTDGTGAVLDAGSGTYTTLRGTLEVLDPATSAAWTLAGVNGAKLKLVHDAGTNECRLISSLVYVGWSTTGAGQIVRAPLLASIHHPPVRMSDWRGHREKDW